MVEYEHRFVMPDTDSSLIGLLRPRGRARDGTLLMSFFVRTLFSLSFLALLFAFPNTSFAQEKVTVAEGYDNIMKQGIIFANICTNGAPESGQGDTCLCRAQGICSLSQIIQLAVNLIILILGISGSIALVMFVYGGFNWVFAQGRSEYIQTGKDTMKHAIIGLAIIFGAYAIINFLIASIGGVAPGATLEDTIEALPAKKDGVLTPIKTDGIIDTN